MGQKPLTHENGRLIALVGNPNVGKSTLFNRLTGLHQHTGNWPGKTVGSALGRFTYLGQDFLLADTPGAYSVSARSAEETAARDFLCFGAAEGVVAVCDASAPERSLILALQVLQLRGDLILCLNLADEARKKGIETDAAALSARLGVPVIPISAARGEGVDALTHTMCDFPRGKVRRAVLPEAAQQAIEPLTKHLRTLSLPLDAQWLALQLLEGEESLLRGLRAHFSLDPQRDTALRDVLHLSHAALLRAGFSPAALLEYVSEATARDAEALCRACVRRNASAALSRETRVDRVLTHRIWALPLMLALLALTLWLTISGANYPSELLLRGSQWLGEALRTLLFRLRAPDWLRGALIDGVYATSARVVSVMLPPMAIFFPLFTLLEDLGYLPRVAFNLDGCFQKCSACGKQALTMCMGLGCNAAGVVGCRIIDSPREKLLAMLTNAFMPCNGRFPTLISLIAVFFIGEGLLGGLWGAVGLTLLIALGAAATFLSSKLLSLTLLRGRPSSFTLELPPFRRPLLGKVLVRSLLDRCLFVLGRAVTVAAPAGLLLWLLANMTLGGLNLLTHCAALLEPLGRLLGLDGVILLAFLLALPANELLLPIMLMCYLSQGTPTELGSLAALGEVLRGEGWTRWTALATLLFSLMHWPCSTTLLTIRKESGSWACTALAAALPTAFGILACLLVRAVSMLLA